MTVTVRHLVGTKEPLDIVIAAHLTEDWTETVVPVVEPLSYIPSMNVEEDFQTNPNIIKTSVINTERMIEDEPLGDDSHYYKTEVIIDIWAETPTQLMLFQDEVNRILWEKRPNGAVRLKKSDGSQGTLSVGTEDSEVEFFETTEINFDYIGSDDDVGHRVSSQGTLDCRWFKIKT